MINIRKRGNVYQYYFESGKVNGKINKSGFRTKNEAYTAGQFDNKQIKNFSKT